MQTLFTGDSLITVQYFLCVSIKIHCCRYWWLRNWEYSTLSLSFRRIYHNTGVGDVTEYRGTTHRAGTNKVYLIAPNTDYSSCIEGNSIPHRENCLCGGDFDVLAESEREQLLTNGAIGHSFVYFSLGFPHDSALKGVFPTDLTEGLGAEIDHTRHYPLGSGQISTFGIGAFLNIQALIYEALLGAEGSQQKPDTGGVRIAQAINYIEDHCEENLSNGLLASKTCMATNPFSRLFKDETGATLQKFVKRRRVSYVYMLIAHTGMNIEEMVTKTDFSNCFHFAYVFCEIIKAIPGKYRDLFLLSPA